MVTTKQFLYKIIITKEIVGIIISQQNAFVVVKSSFCGEKNNVAFIRNEKE